VTEQERGEREDTLASEDEVGDASKSMTVDASLHARGLQETLRSASKSRQGYLRHEHAGKRQAV